MNSSKYYLFLIINLFNAQKQSNNNNKIEIIKMILIVYLILKLKKFSFTDLKIKWWPLLSINHF